MSLFANDAALLEEVSAAVTSAREGVNRLAAAVDRVGGLLPATVRAEWDEAVGLWNELDQIVEGMLSTPGAPEALRTCATMWDRDVGGAASAIAGRAAPAYTKIQDYWEGEAVQAYVEMLPTQRRALEEIKATFSDPISTMHEQMAAKVESFWHWVKAGYWLVGLVLAVLVIPSLFFGGPGVVVSTLVAFVGAAIVAYELDYECLRSPPLGGGAPASTAPSAAV